MAGLGGKAERQTFTTQLPYPALFPFIVSKGLFKDEYGGWWERPRETELQEDGDLTDMLSPASGKQVRDDPDAGPL